MARNDFPWRISRDLTRLASHSQALWTSRRPSECAQRLRTSVAFSPDGKTIVSGSYDNTIKVWDAGECRETTFLGASPVI